MTFVLQMISAMMEPLGVLGYLRAWLRHMSGYETTSDGVSRGGYAGGDRDR